MDIFEGMQYKVDNAIILAAGMSTRFVPVSYELPKGLVRVRGEVLIERQIRQLQEAKIQEIVVVLGHMLEKFLYLREKYGIKIVVNNDYREKNTHSSLYAARDYLKRSYICCADNYYPRNLFREYEEKSYYCAIHRLGLARTERGMQFNETGRITGTRKPAHDDWIMFGHAYFDAVFSKKMRHLLEEYYGTPGTDQMYWENIYAEHVDDLEMYIKKCAPHDIYEFDTIDELNVFDPDYLAENDFLSIANICHVLNCDTSEIRSIRAVKGGLTNRSFSFICKGERYIYRIPGREMSEHIDRELEKHVIQIVAELKLDSSYLYMDGTTGWKLSRYIEAEEPFDFENDNHLSALCEKIRCLQRTGAKCGKCFDHYQEARKLLRRMNIFGDEIGEDIIDLAEKIATVSANVAADYWPVQLCHNDLIGANLIVTKEDLCIIDWEYAGDSDIGSDICYLFADTAEIEKICHRLEIFYKRPVSKKELRHLVGCAGICKFYWCVWGLYLIKNGNNLSTWMLERYDLAREYIKIYETLSTKGEE